MKKAVWMVVLVCLLVNCSTPKPLLPEPTDVLVDWNSLHLSGKLVYVRFATGGNQLVQLDLSTGKSKLLFQPPDKGVLSAAAVSPEGGQIALVYSSPPPSGESYALPTIFLLPADGSGRFEPLLPNVGPKDSYFNPAWTPDGRQIYATHYHQGSGENDPDDTRIVKISLDGDVTSVLDHVTWPEISPDGKKMAFLTIDPRSGLNQLAIAKADGSDPTDLLVGADFPTEDAHRFTPDGLALVFSAALPRGSFQASPFEKLMGIEVAEAHNLPSDLYE